MMMRDIDQSVTPLILDGAAGTRLWPASCKSIPTSFAPPMDAVRSTFAAPLARVSQAAVLARLPVRASAEAQFIVAERCNQPGRTADILLEPRAASLPPRRSWQPSTPLASTNRP